MTNTSKPASHYTFGVFGKGKTGSKLIEILEESSSKHIVFDSKNIPTKDKLLQCDIIISFLPGPPFLEYIDLLIDSNCHVVTGSTGFTWPSNIDQKLKDKKLKWVKAHNFSLGMNLIEEMIKVLSKSTKLFNDAKFSLHEVHHTKKLDAPSGTALSWQEWLGSDKDTKISSERTGDVIGLHQLEFKTANERITLEHEALDRKIFAEGALWSAYQILENKNIPVGLHHFSSLAKNAIGI